jgi:amino acid permease
MASYLYLFVTAVWNTGGLFAGPCINILLVTYSMALVYKQTIPTVRPPLVGEVSAKFCG